MGDTISRSIADLPRDTPLPDLGTLTDLPVKEAAACFQRLMELKGTCTITRKDCAYVYQADERTVQQLFNIFVSPNEDDTSRVNALHILSAMVLLSGKISGNDKLKFLFILMDWDNSRCLRFTEFVTLVRVCAEALNKLFIFRVNKSRVVSEANSFAQEVFEAIDRNKNELIELAEFAAWVDFEPVIQTIMRKFTNNTIPRERFDLYWDSEAAKKTKGKYSAESASHHNAFYCTHHAANCKVLDRMEVKMLLGLFKSLDKSKTGNISYSDLSDCLRKKASTVVGTRQRNTLQNLKIFAGLIAETMKHGTWTGSMEFSQLLKLVAPCSTPKHMRAYLRWAFEAEPLLMLSYSPNGGDPTQRELAESQGNGSKKRDAYVLKPPLPEENVETIKKMFHSLDKDNSGLIELPELEGLTQFGTSVAQVIKRYDLSGDLCLSLEEFLIMMCPDEYRIPNSYEEYLQIFQWCIDNDDGFPGKTASSSSSSSSSSASSSSLAGPPDVSKLGQGGGGEGGRDPDEEDDRPACPPVILRQLEELYVTIQWSSDPGVNSMTCTMQDVAQTGLVPTRILSIWNNVLKRIGMTSTSPLDLEEFLRVVVPPRFRIARLDIHKVAMKSFEAETAKAKKLAPGEATAQRAAAATAGEGFSPSVEKRRLGGEGVSPSLERRRLGDGQSPSIDRRRLGDGQSPSIERRKLGDGYSPMMERRKPLVGAKRRDDIDWKGRRFAL
uniref:EF-hand domain-containing protein n=1 Tax=Chromera velia CCMP2878 TaxID=1169474 RepID=A0A0G4I4Z3_9ALVE|eukprot:Cvel_11017.t1-p1 / transcript=Cvel_11017.t1 / gene=Cvel_11017 / organism=Chromera_velia_CCMP2878 / gene_product=hypothetical protein / transcript_product=hypothetical protein / location=Cvel_scaffold679:44195-50995(+) / protein_length=723 / sequence_SO=supercontig / SO=protein_coding / is_pseudo=false